MFHRMFQSGLVQKWITFRRDVKDNVGARPYTISHLLPAMFMLGVGYFGGCVLLIVEKVYHGCFRRKSHFKLGRCAHECFTLYCTCCLESSKMIEEVCQVEWRHKSKSERSGKKGEEIIELTPVDGERWEWTGNRTYLVSVSTTAAFLLRPTAQTASQRLLHRITTKSRRTE